MAIYAHFVTLANVLDNQRWLDNIILRPETLIQNGTTEMIVEYENAQIAFISDGSRLRISSDLESFTEGTIATIELRSGDGSQIYERITGLSLDAKTFSENFPAASDLVAAAGLQHEIRTDGIEVDDFYDGNTGFDSPSGLGASRYGLVLDQSNPIIISGGFRKDEMVDYKFLADGSLNPNGLFVDLNNLRNNNNINTLEELREGVASFLFPSGSTGATIHTLLGINDVRGTDNEDLLIGREWLEGPDGLDPLGDRIFGRDASELRGEGGDDRLINGMISYGGDGDDIIVPTPRGAFSDETIFNGGTIDTLVIDGAVAFGGDGDDLFVVPDEGQGGLIRMNFDGGAGNDTIAFFADGISVSATQYARDRAFEPTNSFINLGAGTQGLAELAEFSPIGTFPLGNVKQITLTDIENVVGSLGVDNIFGSFADNHLRGMDGDDFIFGRIGNDIIEGGAGIDNLDGQEDMDMVSYESSDEAVEVDLRTQTATGGDAGVAGDAGVDRDLLANFESARGTAFNDLLIGTDEANVLEGLDGNDRLEGLNGDDIIRSGDATFGSQPQDALILPTNPTNESPATAIDVGPLMTLDLNGANPNFVNGTTPVFSVIGQGDGTGQHYYEITVGPEVTALVFTMLPPPDTGIFGAPLRMELTRPDGSTVPAIQGSGSSGFSFVNANLDVGTYGVRIYKTGDPEIPADAGYEFITRAEGFPLDEIRGTDILLGGDGADQLFAGDGEDELVGGQGTDLLDGGANADLMVGGTEDDIYVVRDADDVVFEEAGEGDDIVDTYVTYTVPVNVEVLRMQGTDNIDATGTDTRDLMYGNAGENVLDGGAGADVMQGGDGNDVYTVDDSLDAVIEAAGEGFDNVYSTIDYIIPEESEIESALLQGTAVVLRGSDSDNQLIGNDEINVIDGRGGTDYMLGGKGNDIFQITPEDGAVDVIGDFENGDPGEGDRIAFAGFDAQNTTVTQVSDVSFEVRDTKGTVQESDDTVQQFILLDGFGLSTYSGGELIQGDDYYFG